jgi:hypothetical protein
LEKWVRRINDTIIILKDGRTQRYMQESITPIIIEDAGDDNFQKTIIFNKKLVTIQNN